MVQASRALAWTEILWRFQPQDGSQPWRRSPWRASRHRSPTRCRPRLGRPLEALWHARKGDWHKAHGLAQAEDGTEGAWVHAHLHRIEGDLGNAAYWYRRAGRPVCDQPLPEEWRSIAKALLER